MKVGSKTLYGYILIALSGLIFGSFEVVSKRLSGIPPLQLNLLRFLIGGLSLMPFLLLESRRKALKLGMKDLCVLFALGTLLICVSMTMLQFGLTKVPATHAALIYSTNPVFITILAAFMLKERTNLVTIVSILLGLSGIVVLLTPFDAAFNVNIIYVLISLVIFAIYIVSAKRISRRLGLLTVTGLAMILGCIPLLVYIVATGRPVAPGLNSGNLPLLAYIGVFCSGMAYLAYFKGMELTTTNTGSFTFFLKPIVAAALSTVILKEPPKPRLYWGILLVGAGIIVMMAGKAIEERRRPHA